MGACGWHGSPYLLYYSCPIIKDISWVSFITISPLLEEYAVDGWMLATLERNCCFVLPRNKSDCSIIHTIVQFFRHTLNNSHSAQKRQWNKLFQVSCALIPDYSLQYRHRFSNFGCVTPIIHSNWISITTLPHKRFIMTFALIIILHQLSLIMTIIMTITMTSVSTCGDQPALILTCFQATVHSVEVVFF